MVRERRLLNIWIVRASILLCVLFIATGFLLGFNQSGVPDVISPGTLATILHNIVIGILALHADAMLNAGLLILLLTPIVRLLAGVYVSMRMRDWLYTGIGLLVLMLVVTGLIAGQSGI